MSFRQCPINGAEALREYGLLRQARARIDLRGASLRGAVQPPRGSSMRSIGLLRHFQHRVGMDFEIIGEIAGVETIAVGAGVRNLRRLRKRYGRGRWRKCKGFAKIRVASGEMELAEIHWYEATGIGKREFKIKRYL